MATFKLDIPDMEAAKIAAKFIPNAAYRAALLRVLAAAEKQQKEADEKPKADTIVGMNAYLRKDHTRLVAFTKGARPDFHEPDEQGFSAKVYGNHIDNAMGDDPKSNCGEMTVGLTREDDRGKRTEYFNLATLIALAREAK